MKRIFTIFALTLALSLLLSTVGTAAIAQTSVFHVHAVSAQSTTPTPAPIVASTPAVVTQTKTDHKGLWGLLGLIGLAGLFKRPRREVETAVERPVTRPGEPLR